MVLLLILLALIEGVLGGISDGSSSSSSATSEPRVAVQSPAHARSATKRCSGVRIIKGASSQKPPCMYRPVSP